MNEQAHTAPREGESSMSFWAHLEALRGHLIRSGFAVISFGVLAFLAKDWLFNRVILAPKETYFITNRLFCALSARLNLPALCINTDPVQIINIDMAGQFVTHIQVSLMAGLILAIPFVIHEIWRFIRPGLHPEEQRHSRGAVLITTALFLTGVLFSYFLIVPLSINFLGSYQVSELVANQIALRSYIRIVTTIVLATGILFELPVFVLFLSRVGLVTPEGMKKHRKLAFVLIISLSAIITPPDVFSQVMVSLPIFVLYEISIGISRRVAPPPLG